jgi:hypothetical protein
MTIWVLVVMLYSPGGDLISTSVKNYNTFKDCVEQSSVEDRTVYPMNIKSRAICKRVSV